MALVRSWPTCYLDGRARFRSSCAAAGAKITSYGLLEKSEQNLTIDVARFGSSDAERILLVVSGIHGLEGPTGSVAQSSWAESMPSIPLNCAVVLVHAVNPWGYHYRSRLTANSVDLNRNFVDFSMALPANGMAERLRGRLLMPSSGKRHLFDLLSLIDELQREIGEVELAMAINGGQYQHLGEASFGGFAPEPSNEILRKIVAQHCGTARKVALIDWHTGVGEYGEVAYLMMGNEAGELDQPAVKWWGRSVVTGWSGNSFDSAMQGKASHWNAIPGQFRNTLAKMLPNADVTGATIEFGSFAPWDTWQDTIYDLYCHRNADWDSMETEYMRCEMVRMYNPEDTEWRANVAFEASRLTCRTLCGLSDW